MSYLDLPPPGPVEPLFAVISDVAPELLPCCRWLLLGPHWSKVALPQYSQEPTLTDLISLLRLLRDEAPVLLPLGQKLILASRFAEAAALDVTVDLLLAHSDWSYPTQVIPPPRPDFAKLLTACQARLKRSPREHRPQLEDAIVKVERAVRISAAAKRKRLRMQRSAARSASTK